MTTTPTLIGLCLVLGIATAGGCVAVAAAGAAGAGAYALFEGDIDVQVETDIATAWDGVRKAAAELELDVTRDERDGLRGWLDARRADGTQIRVRASGTGQTSTVVSIRVGVGNKAESRVIWRRIEYNLPAGTPKSREI